MKRWLRPWLQARAGVAVLPLLVLVPAPTQAQSSIDTHTLTEKPAQSKPRKLDSSARHAAEHLYLAGAKAVQQNDLRTAQQDFAKATELNPQNADYATAEQLARVNFITQLLQRSDKARILGREDEARAALQEASAFDANNPAVLQHEASMSSFGAPGNASQGGVQLAGAVRLQPKSELHSFHIRASGSEILKQVLSGYGISPTIDPTVQVTHTSFDADDVNYTEAARMLRLATDSFFVTLDPKRVLVAKDTKANRDRYERQILETVYLPGLTQDEVKSVSDMARSVFDAPQATVQTNGTLIVRAPESRLVALNHTIVGVMDGRAQVDLEIRLIEIDMSNAKNIGLQLPQQFNAFNLTSEVQSIISSNQSLVDQIIANGLAPAGDLQAIVAVLIASGQVTSPLLNQAFGVFGGGLTLTGVTIPGATANFSLNSADTRMLEDVHLHLQDKDAGSLVVGERYPIETSSYSNLTSTSVNIPGVSSAGLSSELAALGLGGGGASQQPIPQVQYQEIGLNLKVTPHVLRSTDVALELELKLQALAGSAVNDIPTLTNRQFTANLTPRDGQSTAFVSDLTKQESRAVSGVPGLTELPGFHSVSDLDGQTSKNTLLILITPHILRRDHLDVAGPAILLPHHD